MRVSVGTSLGWMPLMLEPNFYKATVTTPHVQICDLSVVEASPRTGKIVSVNLLFTIVFSTKGVDKSWCDFTGTIFPVCVNPNSSQRRNQRGLCCHQLVRTIQTQILLVWR